MVDKLLVTLAGEEYKVTQLNLGQIEDLAILAMLPMVPNDPQEDTRNFFKRVIGTISASMKQNNPEMTVEKIRSLPITRDEMVKAYNAILTFSGFVQTAEVPNQGK